MTDFSKALIRCSAFGMLMTEPREVAAKKNGELSKTAKTFLINTYIKEVYDREQELFNKQLIKGKEGEELGISMLSEFTGKKLYKNDIRLNNEYFTGEPDVFGGEMIQNADFIWDTKLSWNIWSFLPNIAEPLDSAYQYQMQGYLELCNCNEGAIAYVLTDTPQHLIEAEKLKLLSKMNVVSELSPEYIEEAARVEINLIYPDIPLEEKILIFPVTRDEEIIEKMKQKVVKAREFLQEFSEKHKSFNKNHLF